MVGLSTRLQEILDGERNVTKLTQYLTTLKDKLMTITTLDTKILDAMIEEDDIANEIVEVDIPER